MKDSSETQSTDEQIKRYVIPAYHVKRLFPTPRPYFDVARRKAYEIAASYNPKHILDVGCGVGKDYAALSSICEKCLGVDPIHENLVIAKKRNPDGYFKVGFAQQLDFPDNCFDVVYMSGVWDILPTAEDMKLAITEAIRVARKAVICLDATAKPRLMRERYLAIPMNLYLRIERVNYDPVKDKANYVWVIDLTKNMELEAS